jgi:hypothetical protein
VRSNTGFVCHNHTTLVSYEMHHVWPIGYHGPNTKANLIKICPNAHSDIHYLMELMLKGKPWRAVEYGPNIRQYAKSGYDQVMAYAQHLAREADARTRPQS